MILLKEYNNYYEIISDATSLFSYLNSVLIIPPD